MSGSRLPRHWLADQLPRPLAEDPLLRPFTLIFEDIADSVRAPVLGFEHFLDPAVAPLDFVRWMAGWLGLNLDDSLPEERQRSTVRAAGALLPLRSTKRGLQGLLESLVGGEVEVIERGGVFREERAPEYDPRVTVKIADPGGMEERQLRRFIEAELPAGVELELLVGRRRTAQEQDSSEAQGGET